MSLASQVSALAGAIRDKINTMTPRLLPAGGTTGQVLSKTNATDYNAQWVTPAAGQGGSGIPTREVVVSFTQAASSKTVEVVDAAALTTHRVIAVVSGEAPPGGYADQAEINPVIIQGLVEVDGTVKLIVSSVNHLVFGDYLVNYHLS
jgi:hypothetical protein